MRLSSIAFAATPAVSKAAAAKPVAAKPTSTQVVARPAVAQVAPLSSSNLGELTFFPEEKTFVSTTSLGYNSEFYSAVPPSGDSTDFHTHTTRLSGTR